MQLSKWKISPFVSNSSINLSIKFCRFGLKFVHRLGVCCTTILMPDLLLKLTRDKIYPGFRQLHKFCSSKPEAQQILPVLSVAS
jgi:hypothetical protein